MSLRACSHLGAIASAFALIVLLQSCTARLSDTGLAVSTAHGDAIRVERAAAWDHFRHFLSPDADRRFLEDWKDAEELFGASAAMTEAHPSSVPPDLGGVEIIIRTHYNHTAARHLAAERLTQRATLQAHLANGARNERSPTTIPPFPDGSAVLLAAWWPIAKDALTPLPVWDAKDNPPRAQGNDYLSWKRVVAVGTVPAPRAQRPMAMVLGGRRVTATEVVNLDRFYHDSLSNEDAHVLMRDPRRRKAAVIALGRPMQRGDQIILVAMNLAVKSNGQWHWQTLWWHDRPDLGPFAAGRPAEIAAPWSNYLMDAALDPLDLAEKHQSRYSSFNPWLEARFPKGRHGGGIESNCVSCHRRASYPPVGFLPITAPLPDYRLDPAFAQGRVRTDFIWGIPRNVR